MATPARMTVPRFVERKTTGPRLTVLTAYDYTWATHLDQAGVDAILVGDSLGMVVQGRGTTLSVTLDQMIYHAEMVGRAVKHALTIVDLPFPINHLGRERVIEAAGRILKETGCQAVKLEGGADQAEVISALVTAGIPVMAHSGLRPQSIHVLGGYRVQRQVDQLVLDARTAQEAGAFGIVLECIPTQVAAQITAELKIPTIGIGAGAGCDGQVLVTQDLLGLTSDYVPRFVKQYADLGSQVRRAVTEYCREVQEGTFPGSEQSFS